MCKKDCVDAELEQEMATAQDIIQAALSAREKAKLGLRWPVKEIVIMSSTAAVTSCVERMQSILRGQLNAKDVVVKQRLPGLKLKIKPEFGKIGPVYGSLSPQIIAKITVDSPETVLGHLEREGVYVFSVAGKDVRVTKDIYEYSLKNGRVKYSDFGEIREIPLDTASWETSGSASLTHTLPF